MGLFSKIGKSIKSATKVISLNNAIKVATNPASALSVGKEALSRATKTLTEGTPKNVKTSKGGALSTGNATVDAAIGGALAGAGTQLAGTDAANAASGAVAQSAFNQWIKNNWPTLLGGVAVVVAGWFAFKNKSSGSKSTGRRLKKA